MTWYYDISDDGSIMDIYEDDAEFTGKITTLQNDGSGFRIPDEVRDVMRETWEKEANLGNSPVMSARAGQILMDMECECIEKGVPPTLQE